MLKIAVKTGVICGLILFVPTIVQIIIGIDKLWINGILSVLLLALSIWLVVKAVKEFRSESENRISFANAFNIPITSFLIVALITVGLTYVHQNIIDPEYGQRTKDFMIQKTQERMDSNPNITEDQKILFLDKIENEDPAFTIKKAMRTLGLNMAVYVVISLIIAAAIKKDLNETPVI